MEGCVVRLHNVCFNGELSAQPIIINFHQLFQTRDAPAILPMIRNEDVLRTVVALLDTSLPDVGPRDVHETVHYPGIRTIILSRDQVDVLEDYRGKASRNKGTNLSPVPCKTTDSAASKHKLLAELYSDSEESQEETSEEASAGETSNRWSWERFCDGLQEFVDEARDRKERREAQGNDGQIPPSAVGVESLIVAAACYEIKLLSTGDTVLQLSLLAVRKRYRHLGIGSYIMELLKTQTVVGQYDALVAHVDSDAIDFFKRHKLIDDLLLNDKFKELKDDWTNSVIMSYLPPFTTDLEMRNPAFFLSIRELEMEMDMARSQALCAYQQQVVCVTRLLKEVKTLREQLDLKREEVDRLTSKLEHEKQKRQDVENRLLMYRLKSVQKLLESNDSGSGYRILVSPISNMSQSGMFILMVVFPLILSQSARGKDCVCELQNSDPAFPENKLVNVEFTASRCNGNITSEKMTEIDTLVLGLKQRIWQLLENVSMLEKEDNGNLYAAVSLRIIELELAEIQDLLDKLNRTTKNYQLLREQTAAELHDMKETMVDLETFDHTLVMVKQRENQRIKRDLERCKHVLNNTTPAPKLSPGRCGLGRMVNVSVPRTYSLTVYGTSYSFGAWGLDANPAPGDENKYWLVVLSSSNVFGNFVRQYNTLSTIILGIGPTDTYISSSNPTTNTIQGPNVVMYSNALYYNCYNTYSVCQFNMTTRSVSTVALPNDAGFNSKFPFAHLATTYTYTDMDFATDESGVYVIYATTSNFGNVVISKVETSNPPVLSQTWSTSLHKKTATNTFMACGVLYATRYLDKEIEEIFYSYDTKTNIERYDLRIHIKKMQANIKFMNYNPRDQLLYVFSDAYIVTYETMFQENH